MKLNQLLNDSESDAQPALRTIQRAVRLHEEVKDMRQDLRIDSGALIPNMHGGELMLKGRPAVPEEIGAARMSA